MLPLSQLSYRPTYIREPLELIADPKIVQCDFKKFLEIQIT